MAVSQEWLLQRWQAGPPACQPSRDSQCCWPMRELRISVGAMDRRTFRPSQGRSKVPPETLWYHMAVWSSTSGHWNQDPLITSHTFLECWLWYPHISGYQLPIYTSFSSVAQGVTSGPTNSIIIYVKNNISWWQFLPVDINMAGQVSRNKYNLFYSLSCRDNLLKQIFRLNTWEEEKKTSTTTPSALWILLHFPKLGKHPKSTGTWNYANLFGTSEFKSLIYNQSICKAVACNASYNSALNIVVEICICKIQLVYLFNRN